MPEKAHVMEKLQPLVEAHEHINAAYRLLLPFIQTHEEGSFDRLVARFEDIIEKKRAEVLAANLPKEQDFPV